MSFTKQNDSLFALIDCNNFYASCERVFNPYLIGKPVVILSNNDGCVIARSNEAKALKIPMGAPAFQFKDIFKKHKVIVLSSNYTLYGQLSSRVMDILANFNPEIEIYSIDEAFLKTQSDAYLIDDMQLIRDTVLQWTGIPVSIGIAPTKTLAKVANRHVKKNLKGDCFALIDESVRKQILMDLDVEEVWGIGKQLSNRLKENGIATAWQLAQTDDDWIRKNLSVVGLRTAWELRGISCLALEEVQAPKKSIVCCKSFGKDVDNKIELIEALSTYTARAAEKARNQNSLATFIVIYLITNRFKTEDFYQGSFHIKLPQPTDYTPLLIHYAKHALNQIFKDQLIYKKVGIMLGGLVSNTAIQQDLFAKNPLIVDQKQQALMKLLDKANQKYGKNKLKFASQGVTEDWQMKRSKCTNDFLTKWGEILKIKI